MRGGADGAWALHMTNDIHLAGEKNSAEHNNNKNDKASRKKLIDNHGTIRDINS